MQYFFLCINCRFMRHFFANLSFAAIYAITLWTPPLSLFAPALVILYSIVLAEFLNIYTWKNFIVLYLFSCRKVPILIPTTVKQDIIFTQQLLKIK